MPLTGMLQPVNAVDLTGGSAYVRAYKSRKRSALLPPFGATQMDVAAAGSFGLGTRVPAHPYVHARSA